VASTVANGTGVTDLKLSSALPIATSTVAGNTEATEIGAGNTGAL
jgi:hypothetical protein